jgi:carboxylesterase type B
MYIKGGMYQSAMYNTAKGGTSYLYAYHFLSSRTMYTYIAPTSPIPGGVCHANELILLFAIPTFTTDDQDKAVSSRMVDLWVNFITTG